MELEVVAVEVSVLYSEETSLVVVGEDNSEVL